jgi:hypothetical protein
MKTKHGFLFGFAVLLATAIFSFTLAGCDNGSATPVDPELSGTIIISATDGGTAPTAAAETGATLYAVYWGGSEPVVYQWKKGGTAIPGGTGGSYIPPTAGSYTVTVSAPGYLSKTSAAVAVTGNTLSTLNGTIIISATSTGTTAATAAKTGDTLYAVYSGTETGLSYRWKNGETNVGTNASSYTSAAEGSYTVTVSLSGYQSKTSAAVTVGGGGPNLDGTWEGNNGAVIIFDGNTFEYFGPNDYSGTFTTSGTTINFVEAELGPASGNFAVSGDTLTLSNHTWDSFVNDTYTKTGGGDLALSGTIVISATDGGEAVASAGTGDTLYAVYSGPEAVAYQWKKDGANVAGGGTGSSYTPDEAGSYTVTVSASGYQSKTSAAVTVNAGAPTVTGVTIRTAGDAESVAWGGTLQFYATVEGTNNPSQDVTWTIDNYVEDKAVINNTGLLSMIGPGHALYSFITVKATSVADETQSTTKALATITNYTAKANGNSNITSSQIDIELDSVGVGADLSFTTITITGGTGGATVESIVRDNTSDYKKWTLYITNVTPGTATMSIDQDNVESATKEITLYKKTSVDISWTETTIDAFSGGSIRSIAYGGGKWVAVGDGGKIATSSTNGATWTEVTSSAVGVAPIRSVAYGNGQFVAVGGQNIIATSVDSVTWTVMSPIFSSSSSSIINSVTYGDEKWIAVGINQRARLLSDFVYSLDGAAWSLAPSSASNSFGDIFRQSAGIDTYVSLTPTSVVYGKGKFVAVGQLAKIAYVSSGSIEYTWSTGEGSAAFATSSITNLVYGNGRFVAGTNNGKLAYSTDGITWTNSFTSSSPYTNYNMVAYGGGQFIAITQEGLIIFSIDGGATWAEEANSAFSSSAYVTGIAYGNKKFIAFGSDGKIAYSNDQAAD